MAQTTDRELHQQRRRRARTTLTTATFKQPAKKCPYCGSAKRTDAATCRSCDDLPGLEPL